MAEERKSSAWNIDELMRWLHSVPGTGDFDEEQVAARYRELLTAHEAAVKRGKPGWVGTPWNQIRDELIHATRKRELSKFMWTMSEDLSQVLVPATVTPQFDGGGQKITIEPAPTVEFIDALTDVTTRLAHQAGCPFPREMIREICENFIHARFSLVQINVYSDHITFEDDGPGPNWGADIEAEGYSTATPEMAPYITHPGRGFLVAREALKAAEPADRSFSLVKVNTHGWGGKFHLFCRKREE